MDRSLIARRSGRAGGSGDGTGAGSRLADRQRTAGPRALPLRWRARGLRCEVRALAGAIGRAGRFAHGGRARDRGGVAPRCRGDGSRPRGRSESWMGPGPASGPAQDRPCGRRVLAGGVASFRSRRSPRGVGARVVRPPRSAGGAPGLGAGARGRGRHRQHHRGGGTAGRRHGLHGAHGRGRLRDRVDRSRRHGDTCWAGRRRGIGLGGSDRARALRSAGGTEHGHGSGQRRRRALEGQFACGNSAAAGPWRLPDSIHGTAEESRSDAGVVWPRRGRPRGARRRSRHAGDESQRGTEAWAHAVRGSIA